MPLQVGQIVDHYRLDHVVARGRATVVFAAFDIRLQRRVALKVLNEEFSASPAFRERFAREAATAAQLGEHPNIVTVYDSNSYEGSLYFVTQFIDGVSLRELLQRQPSGRPLQPAAALAFLTQIAAALDFAHRQHMVHRDVKPANIMIKLSEIPMGAYLIDFGITKRLDAAAGQTNYGTFIGTADYASPEQIRVAADIDRRADVYSLACSAFEALTGHAPYASAPGAVARIAAHLEGPIPSAVALRPQLPAEVDDVFARALAKDKTDRYATCGDFVRDLEAAFPLAEMDDGPQLEPGSALPAPKVGSAAALGEPGRGPGNAAGGDDGRVAKQAPQRSWILAVAAVAVAGVVLFAWWRSEDSNAAERTITSNGKATSAVVTTVAPTLVTTTATSTTATATTAAPTTAAPTTAAPATATPTTSAPITAVPTTIRGPFGDIVGQPVAQPTNAQGAAAFALQAHKLPAAIANDDTPTYFYAQWLRLLTPLTTNPVLASANGYMIDAGQQVDLTNFEVGTDGKLVTFSECAVECQPLATSIAITPACAPGPGCAVFASDSGGLMAMQRATISLRSPAITLLFHITAPQNVTGISDATGTVRYDGDTQYFSVTLPMAPPPGTATVATISFADGTTSKLTITYG